MNASVKNCRICLDHEDDTQFHRIFPENCHLALWIFLVSGVHVIESKSCPALICESCILSLGSAVELRNSCQQAQDFFRSRTKSELLDGIDDQTAGICAIKEEDEICMEEETKTKRRRRKAITKSKPKERCFCNKCYKSFCDGYLKKHEYLKHMDIPEEDLFECDFCGLKTKTKQLLRAHINFAHSQKPKQKFICGTCGMMLSSKGNLLSHEKTHLELDPSEYIPCPVCHKTFREKRFMTEHKKLVHEKSKVFKCTYPDCNHVSTCKGAFQKHNKSVHLKIRDFICADCDASFSTNSQLTRHIRIHTGEKPFQCNFCTKPFRLSSHRKRHEEICQKRGEVNNS